MTNPSTVTAEIFEAMKEGRLTEGDLWTPPQVGAFTGNLSETAWVLSAKVTTKFLAAIRRGGESVGMTSQIFDLGGPHRFWVVAHQIERVQHRLLLPLVGDTVQAFVRATGSHNVKLYFSAGGLVEDSVAKSVQLSAEHRQALRRDHTPLHDPLALTQEILILTVQLLMSQAISPPSGMELPVDVFLTAVSPPELADWAAREH